MRTRVRADKEWRKTTVGPCAECSSRGGQPYRHHIQQPKVRANLENKFVMLIFFWDNCPGGAVVWPCCQVPLPQMPAILDPESSAYKKAKRQYIKATKNRKDITETDWTPFRAAEKKYKARFPPPDLSNVLDLALLDPNRVDEISQGVWTGRANAAVYEFIGKNVVTIPRIPGAG